MDKELQNIIDIIFSQYYRFPRDVRLRIIKNLTKKYADELKEMVYFSQIGI